MTARRAPTTPLAALGQWLASPDVWRMGVLALAVVVSGLAVVDATHRARSLFGELEQLRVERDALLERRGRLLLERSAFSAYSRVESIAVQELEMKLPRPADTELVAP